MTSLTYLASPYASPSIAVRESRYTAACHAAAFLMKLGHCVFSPIAHSHKIGEVLGMSIDGEFWKRQDVPVLRHCGRVVVLKLPGWDTSKGVAWEVEMAEALHIPIEYLDPEEIA